MPTTLEKGICNFVKTGKRVSVNWLGIARLKIKLDSESGRDSTFTPLLENLLDYLTEIGVLTFSTKDSWTLTGGGFDLSPKKPAPYLQLYFKDKDEAEAYRDAFYRDLAFHVFVKPARETV